MTDATTAVLPAMLTEISIPTDLRIGSANVENAHRDQTVSISPASTSSSHSSISYPVSPGPIPWPNDVSYPAPTSGAAPQPTVVAGQVSTDSGLLHPMKFHADRSWEQTVYLACGERGPAVQALADHLRRAQPALERAHATRIAVELLQHESISTCDTIAVLLKDGWEGILGELLACARTLSATQD